MNPAIMMPNRMFLLGVIYGINIGRKISLPPNQELTADPVFMGNEDSREDFEKMYHGSLLHFDCPDCGRIYTYEHPNDIPESSLKCDTEGCNNILIVYGITEFSKMRLGNMNIFGG